jgi:hypothetical protein
LPDVTVYARGTVSSPLIHFTLSATVISRGLGKYASSVFVEESGVMILAEMFFLHKWHGLKQLGLLHFERATSLSCFYSPAAKGIIDVLEELVDGSKKSSEGGDDCAVSSNCTIETLIV